MSDYAKRLMADGSSALGSTGFDINSLQSYLASTIQRIAGLESLMRGDAERRAGNGWEPLHVHELIYKVEPRPVREVVQKATRSRLSRILEPLSRLRKIEDAKVEVVGTPTLVYVPIWFLKGFHECHYTRSNVYRIELDSDVVAVEVEGRNRNIVLERRVHKLIPARLAKRLRTIGSFLSGERKYFVLDDVLELASSREEGQLYVTAVGREGSVLKEVVRDDWKLERVFDLSQLKTFGIRSEVAKSNETKEGVIERFRSRVVRLPMVFKEILKSAFEVTQLTLYYVPFYSLQVRRETKIDGLVVNGASAERADPQTAHLVSRHAGA